MIINWTVSSQKGCQVFRCWRKITLHPNYSLRLIHNSTSSQDIFHYTSGRWLYNESSRLVERRISLNLTELKRIAAQCVNQRVHDIKQCIKLAEGGFNRVFQFTFNNGSEILARLPYPSTKPEVFAIASEVATIDLVRKHGIPAPKTLHYSASCENLVGSEFIIMEKLPGSPLGDRWYDLTEEQRLKVIAEVVKMEAKLSTIDLPLYGSVYYEHDLPSAMQSTRIPTANSSSNLCVGATVNLRWWYKERGSLPLERGPYSNPYKLLHAAADKELAWLKAFGKSRLPLERAYRECMNYEKSSPKDHITNLEKYLQLVPYIIPQTTALHKPILRHPDLQPNNIFVSDDFKVTGILDWQHCSILPQFLAAGIPKYFQNYHDDESMRFVPPKVPSNFEQMNPEEQAEALEIYRRRHLHFFYLGFTQRFNPEHFEALSRRTDLLTRKIFDHASEPWKGNNVPLKADLIHITQCWQQLMEDNGFDHETIPGCPISFSESETQETLNILQQQEETDTQLENVRNAIGINVDGWIANEEYQGAVERAAFFKQQAIESLDTEQEKEMTSRHWPFDDFDEDE